MRERLPLPKAIQEAPMLHMGLELYYDAFLELTTCRPIGMAMGSIPWNVIKDYAVAFNLDEEQRADLFYYIRMIDNAYLDKQRKQEKGGKRSQSQDHSSSSPPEWGSGVNKLSGPRSKRSGR